MSSWHCGYRGKYLVLGEYLLDCSEIKLHDVYIFKGFNKNKHICKQRHAHIWKRERRKMWHNSGDLGNEKSGCSLRIVILAFPQIWNCSKEKEKTKSLHSHFLSFVTVFCRAPPTLWNYVLIYFISKDLFLPLECKPLGADFCQSDQPVHPKHLDQSSAPIIVVKWVNEWPSRHAWPMPYPNLLMDKSGESILEHLQSPNNPRTPKTTNPSANLTWVSTHSPEELQEQGYFSLSENITQAHIQQRELGGPFHFTKTL